jgi:hypothetical protein
MKTTSQAEAPFFQLLLQWITWRVSRTLAAIRPVHRASQITAAVAASNNPTGV